MVDNNDDKIELIETERKPIEVKKERIRARRITPVRVYQISPIIGNKLKSLRALKQLTLGEVANRSGFSAQAISLCERAQRMPSPNMLLILSKIYDYPEEELFNLREETIIDSVRKFGENAPVSIRNEYEILMNVRENLFTNNNFTSHGFLAPENVDEIEDVSQPQSPSDYLDLGSEPATEEEIQMAKAYLLALRSINKK